MMRCPAVLRKYLIILGTSTFNRAKGSRVRSSLSFQPSHEMEISYSLFVTRMSLSSLIKCNVLCRYSAYYSRSLEFSSADRSVEYGWIRCACPVSLRVSLSCSTTNKRSDNVSMMRMGPVHLTINL